MEKSPAKNMTTSYTLFFARKTTLIALIAASSITALPAASNEKPIARTTTVANHNPPALPKMADLHGSVVDDETGATVTNFWLQSGVGDPAKPDAVTWRHSYLGPISTGPRGRFSAQAQKPGQTWRVLADGYLPQPLLAQPLTEQVKTVETVVRLKRGGELRGTILDSSSKPIAGARVLLITDEARGFCYGDAHSKFRGSTATTDATGHFRLRGVGTGEQTIFVASAEGRQCLKVRDLQAGKEAVIQLPEPGALTVHYDIPGDTTNAELAFTLRSWDKQVIASEGLQFYFEQTVTNGGELLLTNLSPGTYDFYRNQHHLPNTRGKSIAYERRTVVIHSGQTEQVNLVRKTGWRVHGQIADLERLNIQNAYLYVRSGTNTFDAQTYRENFGPDGKFQTPLLEPGDYKIAVEVYEPEPEQFEIINGHRARVWRSGIRSSSFSGTGKITVTAASEPPLVDIKLEPTGKLAKQH